jgi:hypothetical protein
MALDSPEREVFKEEVKPGHIIRLVASGPVDALQLEAIEDYIRHQRLRLERCYGP